MEQRPLALLQSEEVLMIQAPPKQMMIEARIHPAVKMFIYIAIKVAFVA